MTICIIATICRESGALSIYNQLMKHLKNERKPDDIFTIFIDPNMPTPEIKGVRYIKYSTLGFHRIKFDYYDFKRICAEYHITPDVIFSLNNTGVLYRNIRQLVYYHQPLPLYKYNFSIFDKKERAILLFKKYFPLFVRKSLKWTDTLIVQTNIIRNLFSIRFHFPPNRIEIAFPDVEMVTPDSIATYPFEKDYYHFVYPATVVGYKEHTTIARALMALNNKTSLDNIKIHLTLNEGEHVKLQSLIKLAGLENNFVFHGPMPHEKLLSMYRSADALLFPSVIETIGLPLLEAAGLGLPVLANDLEYVKDVLKGYEGLMTVPLRDYNAWGTAIETICIERPHYEFYQRSGGSDWPKVFKLIHGE